MSTKQRHSNGDPKSSLDLLAKDLLPRRLGRWTRWRAAGAAFAGAGLCAVALATSQLLTQTPLTDPACCVRASAASGSCQSRPSPSPQPAPFATHISPP